MDHPIILYGAYGYTGRIIATALQEAGHRALLSGREIRALDFMSTVIGWPREAIGLDDTEGLKALLEPAKVVIHAAGPFKHTAKKMAEACIATNTHYVDITGEYGVFEQLASMDEAAKNAGVMLLPGAGFDVVPSDCLAMKLKEALPTATHLQLGFRSMDGGISQGTIRTMTERLGSHAILRENEVVKPVPMAKHTIKVNLGDKYSKAVTVPLGDVITAWHSTGIPNIETFLAAPPGALAMIRSLRYLSPILKTGLVKSTIRFLNSLRAPGPSPDKRDAGKAVFWGKVWDENEQTKELLLEVPNGYKLTGLTAMDAALKIVNGKFKPGFQTPATAFGDDWITNIKGCKWIS